MAKMKQLKSGGKTQSGGFAKGGAPRKAGGATPSPAPRARGGRTGGPYSSASTPSSRSGSSDSGHEDE